MKYLCIIPDGLADEALDELGGKTPMEAAHTPNLDRWVSGAAEIGAALNIPPGYPAGSDVAIMSIAGLDPRRFYTGRAPIEAAAMGIQLAEDEVAFRCNFVTVEDDTMVDFSAGHITSEEARQLVAALNEAALGPAKFYTGVSYRNICVLPDEFADASCTPPHDLTDKAVVLPEGPSATALVDLMQRSREVLADHPVNLARIERGQRPATQIWLWGQGKTPRFETFAERYGMSGGLITAVDLVRGLGVLTGLEVIEVPGATGYYDTDYRAKAEYAARALQRHPFCLVHIEATDEAGHEGDVSRKIEVFEAIDEKVVGTLQQALQDDEYRVLVVPDHPTPVRLKTHVADPVPYLIFDSRLAPGNPPGSGIDHDRERAFSECVVSEVEAIQGHTLLARLFEM